MLLNLLKRLCAISILLTMLSALAQAQVYVFVRRDANDLVHSENIKDGYCITLRKVSNKNAGEWESLLETNKPGWVVVYGVADRSKNIKPKYFVSFGKGTSKEAHTEARAAAAAYGNTVKQYPFWLMGEENKNKFPLERPIPNMPPGTCKTETVKPSQ